jgi:hypothetical protein
LHKQAKTHDIKMINARITLLKREGVGFVGIFDEHQVKTRFVFGNGIVDKSPQSPGFKEAISEGSIRYCPVCDGRRNPNSPFGERASLRDSCMPRAGVFFGPTGRAHLINPTRSPGSAK